MIRPILLLHITPTRSKTAKSCRLAFETAKQKQLECSRMFAKDLYDRLPVHGPLSGPPPQQWEQFKTLVTESARLTTGPKKRIKCTRTGSMRTTSTSKNSWTTRRKPSSSGRMTSPPLQSVTASNTSKGRPRRHFAKCRTSGGRRRQTKSKPTLPQRTKKCSSAPSRKSTPLPSHAPRRSCQLTAQPCLRRKAASTQGGGNTSVPTDSPLWTPLDQIPQKIMSMVLRFGRNPYCVSGRFSSKMLVMRRLRMTRARIFPATDWRDMPW